MKWSTIAVLAVISLGVAVTGQSVVSADKNTTTTTSSTTTPKPTSTTKTTTKTTPATKTSTKPTPTTTPSTKPTPTTTATTKTSTKSTPATKTTPKPMPTTTPNPDQPPKYALKEKNSNVTCLLMQAKISMNFTYTMANKTQTVMSKVPADAEYDGVCGNITESLNLGWQCSKSVKCELELNFNKTGSSFNLRSVNFTYIATGVSGHASKVFANKMKTDLGTSYNCTPGLNLTIDGNASVTMTDFTVQAFMQDSSDSPNFAAAGSSCGGGNNNNKTDAIVPIAVGAALAAMVVIVLIGYCIGRRRTMAGYQSMDS